MSENKVRKVCAHCGGENLSIEAVVTWDFDRQDYLVTDVCDKGHGCEDCGGECKINDIHDRVEPAELATPVCFYPEQINTRSAIIAIACDTNPHELDEDRNVAVANAISHALGVLGIEEPPMNDDLGDLYDELHDKLKSSDDVKEDEDSES